MHQSSAASASILLRTDQKGRALRTEYRRREGIITEVQARYAHPHYNVVVV
jgi:hypothetical protein